MSSLTTHKVSILSTIVQAAMTGAKVTFIAPGDIVKIRTGTVRHIVKSTDDWAFPSGDYDVRDCALRITETSGLDVAYPVRDLMDVVERGEFGIER